MVISVSQYDLLLCRFPLGIRVPNAFFERKPRLDSAMNMDYGDDVVANTQAPVSYFDYVPYRRNLEASRLLANNETLPTSALKHGLLLPLF